MNLIGIDFAITKPAACIWDDTNGVYRFMGWPRNDHISEKRKTIYRESGVQIFERTDTKNPHKESSAKMRFAVENGQYIAELIVRDLLPYLKDSYIALEGLSFGSTGDAILQLSGYKYLLMQELRRWVPLERMYTYAPITVKKTAGCSKRGLTKNDMIRSFVNEGHEFSETIGKYPELFMKAGLKNYIELLDDLVDGYWVLQTMKEKEL